MFNKLFTDSDNYTTFFVCSSHVIFPWRMCSLFSGFTLFTISYLLFALVFLSLHFPYTNSTFPLPLLSLLIHLFPPTIYFSLSLYPPINFHPIFEQFDVPFREMKKNKIFLSAFNFQVSTNTSVQGKGM